MCGIAGHFSWDGAATPLDLELLRHRGPDASGSWLSSDGKLWLGHTRLSILDLSPSGAQPMPDPASGNVIVFNGEIYNHPELRQELTALGCSFRGTSDTETLLLGYQVWKERLIPRLKGMFAFAIYDAAQQSLFLARDRLGIKPLYLARNGNRILFSSEIRPLAAAVQARPDAMTLARYLQWGCSPHDNLIFSGIEELQAGQWMRVSRDGNRKKRNYWPGPFSEPSLGAHASRTGTARKIRRLLETSVRQHLLSDVPVACLLSGGIDSSIVTALAAQHSPEQVSTFSIGFDDPRLDESRFAQLVADRYDCRHHHIRLEEKEVLEDVGEALKKMDMPSIDAINTYIVSKRVAASGFKVALSGLGGDELFGGYPQFRMIPRFKYLALMPDLLKDLIVRAGKGKHLLRDVPKTLNAGEFDLWWRRIWNSSMLAECGLPVVPHSPMIMPMLEDDFGRISWSELHNYMRDMLLRDTDQMTMAHSLELRVPFLDHELVETVLQLPEEEKLAGPYPKWLLVESCMDLLPPEVYQRSKMGFELPMDSWLRGPLSPFVREGLDVLAGLPYIHAPMLSGLLAQFNERRLHWSKLWAAVVLGLYLKRTGTAEILEQAG